MALLPWDESLRIHIAQFDAEHEHLVTTLNQLYDAMTAGGERDALGKLLDELVNETMTHFSSEEQMMMVNGYPDYEGHKREHRRLAATIRRLQEEFRAGKSDLNLDTMNFLKSWLKVHIKETDMECASYLRSRGIQ